LACFRILIYTVDKKRALRNYAEAALMMPTLFGPHYEMAKICCEQGDYENAERLAGYVIEKEKKVENPGIDVMKREMRAMLDSVRMKRNSR
jgi:hypothetical protein